MVNNKTLEKILLLIIYIGSFLVIAVPLIVIPKTYFPYIILKTIIWRIIVEAVFLSWLALILYRPEYRPKKTLLFWILGFFVLVWLVSTLFSSSFTRSFWGNWERMGGFFTYLHYFLWWIVIVNVFKNVKQWYRLLNFSLIVSIVICLYSIGQRMGLGFTLEAGLARVNGTIGNSAYLAAYLIFHLFIALYFYSRSNNLLKRTLYASAFALQSFILLLTGTRGAQLALAISFLLYLIVAFVFKFYKEKSIRLYTLACLIAVLFVSFILVFHNQDWVKNNFYLSRVSNVTLQDNTIQTRFISWRAGTKSFRDNLLIGVGPENYNIAFNQYFSPDFYEHTGNEVWFDRAHNTLVDMAAMLGIFGLLGYLSIFTAVIYILWNFYKKQGYIINVVILALLFITYFIQNVFVFDSLNSLIPFFLMLGLVDFFHRLNTVKDQKEVKEKKIFKLPGVLTVGSVVVIFLVLLFSINVKQIKANSHTYDAFVAQQTGNLVAFLDGYKNSIEVAINPIDPIFLLAQNSPDVVIKNLDKLDREKIKEIFNQAVEYAEEGKKLDPKNVYNHYILAKLYNGFAELTKESQYLYKALETLEEGKKLSPNRIRLCWVEAQTYIIAGEYDQAIRALDQSIAIIDSPSEPYWFKSIVYFEQKKDDLAYEAAEQAINRGYRFHSIDDLKKLIPYFEEKENDEILIKLYTNLSSKEPKNTTYYEKLVAIYDKQGEYQKAMDILKKAAENIPAYSDRAWELYSALEQKL